MLNMRSRIIIIDDEEIILDSCTEILGAGDFEVTTAVNGTVGLQMIRDLAPDLVFVDLKMPGISGIEVLQQALGIDPLLVIVVITGYATVSAAVEAMKQGAYDFLPKPFTPDELRIITRRGVERRKLVVEAARLRREKEMLRENFAAIVSHELKAPLGVLQQNLYAQEIELDSVLTEAQKARCDRMIARIDEMNKLIHSWLRVLSVDVNKIKESFGPISVATCIAKALDNIDPHSVRKDMHVVTEVPEDLPAIEGEEMSFTEVLTNIIGNAIKYSYAGGEVRVKAEKAGDRVKISISDTGPGISKEELPYIFEDFYRGKSGQAEEGSHGLGLTISRRIIEAHHGTVTVESEPGKGATFIISLPI